MVAASTAALPSVDVGTRPRMARPQSRLAGSDGSVSGVFSNESRGSGAAGRLRFCRRFGPRDLVVELGQGGEEALLLTLEEGFVFAEFEDRGHEVVLAGALFEAADQVGDRDVELGRVDHGGVEQEASRRPS